MNNDVKLESYNSVCFHNFIFFIIQRSLILCACCNSFLCLIVPFFPNLLWMPAWKNVIILATWVQTVPISSYAWPYITSALLALSSYTSPASYRTPPDYYAARSSVLNYTVDSLCSANFSARDQEADVSSFQALSTSVSRLWAPSLGSKVNERRNLETSLSIGVSSDPYIYCHLLSYFSIDGKGQWGQKSQDPFALMVVSPHRWL